MVTRAQPRRAEAGYNMVVLMVAVTLLTVFVAAALPLWTQQMKREREAELIFRGWQYAEAIRVFQQRHGRFPTRLDELVEVKPRSIRKLWEDPMTENGEWGLVFQGGVAPDQGGRELGGGGLQQGQRPPGAGAGSGGRGGRNRSGGGSAERGDGERETVGPIIGVHSRSEEESIKVLFGEESYDQWVFTVEKLSTEAVSGIAPEGVQRQTQSPTTPTTVGGRPVLPRTRWIGKPFPEGAGFDVQRPGAGASGRPPGDGNRPGAGRDGRPPGARPGRGGRGPDGGAPRPDR